MRRGARLVVVDPRRTRAAALADVHLAARPGTEIALFSAMAHHIVESGLHDDSFIARRCRNFAGFWEAARHYTTERVDELCGVPAAEIRRAAEIYASADRGSIVYGLGVTEHRSGVAAVQSLANLALITGNVGRPSTGINALRGQNDVQGATDMCAPEWLPGYQGWEDSAAVSAFEREWEVALPRPVGVPMFFSQMWERALSGELKGLIVVGSDPALSEGNTRKVELALKALELLVVCEVLPSRTVEFADVVLPAASYAEKTGTFVNTDRRVQLVRGAIEPVGESRPDWSILSGLAARMGYGGLRYSGPEEIFEEIRRLVPLYAGITYSRLESGGLQWPCPTEDHPGTPFLHAEGFKWGRALLKAVDYEPPEEEPDDEYPFLLTTGRTYMQYNAGNMTARTKTGTLEPENFVQLSPADARALGVSDGDRVRVSTRRGALEVSAAVAPVTEGVIWMPFHYPDAPTNLLTNDAIDLRCGITELKVCAARVERCNAVAPARYPDAERVTDAT